MKLYDRGLKQLLRLTDYPILHQDYDSDRWETHIINCWETKEMSIEEKKVVAWVLLLTFVMAASFKDFAILHNSIASSLFLK